MLQAISTTATVPMVRVPWLEPGILMKTLDAGAYGVICPMVNTREDAQNARRLDPLRAARHAQLRPGARAALRRRRLSAARQRHHRHLRDDRDRAGARQPRRRSCRSKGWTRSTSARRTCRSSLGCTPVLRRRRPEGRSRRSTTSWRAPRRTASSPASTTARPEAALRAHRQGLPVRHRQLRRAADGRRRAAGAGARCGRRRRRPRPAPY